MNVVKTNMQEGTIKVRVNEKRCHATCLWFTYADKALTQEFCCLFGKPLFRMMRCAECQLSEGGWNES